MLFAEQQTTPGQVLQLNLDTGHKSSIARRVQCSKQNYSSAFRSKAPRLPKSPETAFKGPTYRYVHCSWMETKDATRQQPSFRSSVSRLSTDSNMYRKGMHPNMQMPQGEYEQAPSKVEHDKRHWERLGNFESHAARLSPMPVPVTVDANDDSEQVIQHNTVAKEVADSPNKLSVMRSNALRLEPPPDMPYTTNLGPGSFDYSLPADLAKSNRPMPTMASSQERFKKPSKEAHKTSLGGGVSAQIGAREAWDKSVFIPSSPSGRHQVGPQLGSFENEAGLSRSASPDLRSPDIQYQITNAPQKRNLNDVVSKSPRRYKTVFGSKTPRVAISWQEKLALSQSGMDAFDLSVSAAGSWATLSQTDATSMAQPKGLSSFKSATNRFSPIKAPSPGPDGVWLGEDSKAWSVNLRQPLTSKKERMLSDDWTQGDTRGSPGPGAYVGSPLWTEEQWRRDPSPKATRRLFSSSPSYH